MMMMMMSRLSALCENRVPCALCLLLYLSTWRPTSSPAASCMHQVRQYLAMVETTSNQLSSNVKMATFLVYLAICLSILINRRSAILDVWHLVGIERCASLCFLRYIHGRSRGRGAAAELTRCLHVRPVLCMTNMWEILKHPISNRAGRHADLTSSRPQENILAFQLHTTRRRSVV